MPLRIEQSSETIGDRYQVYDRAPRGCGDGNCLFLEHSCEHVEGRQWLKQEGDVHFKGRVCTKHLMMMVMVRVEYSSTPEMGGRERAGAGGIVALVSY